MRHWLGCVVVAERVALSVTIGSHAVVAKLVDEKMLDFRVLRQTTEDVVVNKPAGMATELTTDRQGVSLIARIRKACAENVTPRLVHRLDRATGGVMIVSLTRGAASFYGEQIREGVWEKYYLARIAMPANKSATRALIGEHRAYLREESKAGQPRAVLVKAGGKPSFLQIRAIEPAPEREGEGHVLIRLLTGRLHQIRVMLSGMGYPLIGDDFYGGRDGPFYLEHTALWYVDCASREVRLAHDRNDPARETLAPAMQRALDEILRPA